MNNEEKKQIKDFEYWVNTNNEKGVCWIPDYICNRVLNLIDKKQKEIDKQNKVIDLMTQQISYLGYDRLRLVQFEYESEIIKEFFGKVEEDDEN